MKKLTAEFKDSFGFSVSHTTRAPRPGETDGVEYHFVTRDTMEQLVREGGFLEHAVFSGNMYGTSCAAVGKVAESGKICILDIDVQGVKLIKQSDLEAPSYVFIKPPSREALEKRLRARRTESEDSLAKRLAAADAEMEYGETPGNFDIIIVNDDLEKAYQELRTFMLPKLSPLLK
jgi:guanylate kinase